jgi:hypothetical protein
MREGNNIRRNFVRTDLACAKGAGPQSVIFRRHVDSLVKAARGKNLDVATLASVRVTMGCGDCQKLVRGK